ncbi:hypothetical protein JOD43_004403 [Pullulanibacillus pueri]|nr:hypothetical protein [Pullulanibacillus pueri]
MRQDVQFIAVEHHISGNLIPTERCVQETVSSFLQRQNLYFVEDLISATKAFAIKVWR